MPGYVQSRLPALRPTSAKRARGTYVLYIVLDKYHVLDRWTGLDLVEEVADRFDRSVGPKDAIPVRIGDKEWKPLLQLIRAYSRAKLPTDKMPRVVARFQAQVYDAYPLGNGELSQWTSPATPMVVFFYDWPRNTGQSVAPSEYRIVGTFGDLRIWIAQRREDRHFLFVDFLLVGILPLILGVYAFVVERRSDEESDRGTRKKAAAAKRKGERS